MGNIKLLDCTLRDGGYVNDWEFGAQAISEIIPGLADAGIDILEIGFLKNEPYREGRTVFNSMEQVSHLIGSKHPGVQYAVMAEVVNPLPLDMLAPAGAESADIIRVIVWKTKHTASGEVVDALEEGFAYCQGIVEKGYKLCVQPARVDQYSDAEFVQMVRLFAKLHPMAMYVVDSWGTQNPEQLVHYMRLADRELPRETALGYHGHNNMMQALAAAQAMLREGFQREQIIDASLYGIGRGAGNLHTELIAKYMNERLGRKFDLLTLIKLCERWIRPIRERYSWGYSLPFFVTAMLGCNPEYASDYEHTQGLDATQIYGVISRMAEMDQTIYRKEAAERALKQFLEK